CVFFFFFFFFFSSRRRHTRSYGDWSSDVCSSDLVERLLIAALKTLPRSDGIGTVVPMVETPTAGPLTGVPGTLGLVSGVTVLLRSEERRVGKECRAGWGRWEWRKKEKKEKRGGG